MHSLTEAVKLPSHPRDVYCTQNSNKDLQLLGTINLGGDGGVLSESLMPQQFSERC